MATLIGKDPKCLSLSEIADKIQFQHLCATESDDRKAKGQFFTPAPVARFMAGLLPLNEDTISILDPGAGAGALTAALCDRLLCRTRPCSVHFDLIETDEKVLPSLHKTAAICQKRLGLVGHVMTYRVIAEDFVLKLAPTKGTFFEVEDSRPRYDAVILNPPYFKINKSSVYAQAMSDIVHGQPNMYALFMAVAASLLKPGASMAAITPRSFCNGLYFRGFRKWFLDRMTLNRIHLFRSRKDTFREASVLQESVVTLSTRSDYHGKSTIVSRSEDREFNEMHEQVLPAGQIVEQFGCDRLIYVPETNEDAEIVRYAKQWELSFEGRGLRISTGPVVMFRVAEFLQASHHVGVPLLSSHNVKRFATIWPVVKAKWPLAFADSDRSKKHLVPVRNYVLLKRFSAKEERRRLTAGCIFRRAFPFERVAIENHLNYVYHFERELTVDETWGITAIFNSVLFDRYFRTLSGNTQVNSTEIRNLHFPDIPTIARIGSRIRRTKKELLRKSEHIVLEELGINGSLRRYLEAKAE